MFWADESLSSRPQSTRICQGPHGRLLCVFFASLREPRSSFRARWPKCSLALWIVARQNRSGDSRVSSGSFSIRFRLRDSGHPDGCGGQADSYWKSAFFVAQRPARSRPQWRFPDAASAAEIRSPRANRGPRTIHLKPTTSNGRMARTDFQPETIACVSPGVPRWQPIAAGDGLSRPRWPGS
jgi:hypothetical protein